MEFVKILLRLLRGSFAKTIIHRSLANKLTTLFLINAYVIYIRNFSALRKEEKHNVLSSSSKRVAILVRK